MADKISRHEPRRPRRRVASDDVTTAGLFYPGEVARMEGFTNIDYRQLRRLFRLVRRQADAAPGPDRAWARYTMRDIAAVKIAVRLCTNPDDPLSCYLVIAPLERACAALRDQGIDNPLLDVPMHREGRTIFAEIDGAKIDPTNGQMQLRDARDDVLDYLNRVDLSELAADEKAVVRRAIRAQSRRVTQPASMPPGYVAL